MTVMMSTRGQLPADNTIPDGNMLLARVSEHDMALLSPHLREVHLAVRHEVEQPHQPIRQVVFPVSGLLSVVATLPRGRDIEVGIIGRDGMTGSALVQDDDRVPFSTIVQIECEAFAIDAGPFRSALDASPELHRLFSRYARTLAIQVATAALANGRSKLEERLARWLLMVQDRLEDERIPLTHEYLAMMLGVRRPGVTVALHMLEGKGLIKATRGEIAIKNRDGLLALADGAYGTAEREYERLMGSAP